MRPRYAVVRWDASPNTGIRFSRLGYVEMHEGETVSEMQLETGTRCLRVFPSLRAALAAVDELSK